jgi:hypothetical protein
MKLAEVYLLSDYTALQPRRQPSSYKNTNGWNFTSRPSIRLDCLLLENTSEFTFIVGSLVTAI